MQRPSDKGKGWVLRMKTLVLNGFPKGDPLAEQICKSLLEELKARDYQGQLLNLADMDIATCLGCFGCWVKTPGVCVIDDAGREVARAFIQSGLVVLVSPITFGGYSSELKKVFDRIIPILSPFFKKVGGETHHQMRYQRYPHFLVIGALPEPDQAKEAIFNTMVARNALNAEFQSWASGVCYGSQSSAELRGALGKLVAKVGGSR